MSLPTILQFAHLCVRSVLTQGGIAVDATVGNGNDTLFLAKQVSVNGKVYGFDIQAQALENTEERLQKFGQRNQVRLFLRGHHEPWEEVISPKYYGKIDAVMFNLGYLPHGNSSVMTKPETTLIACEQALQWLKVKGMITLVLYTGHPGGNEETQQVIHWCRNLPSNCYQVNWHQLLNRSEAPSLVAIEKKGLE